MSHIYKYLCFRQPVCSFRLKHSLMFVQNDGAVTSGKLDPFVFQEQWIKLTFVTGQGRLSWLERVCWGRDHLRHFRAQYRYIFWTP
jgi:hypothetical protein